MFGLGCKVGYELVDPPYLTLARLAHKARQGAFNSHLAHSVVIKLSICGDPPYKSDFFHAWTGRFDFGIAFNRVRRHMRSGPSP